MLVWRQYLKSAPEIGLGVTPCYHVETIFYFLLGYQANETWSKL